ncbi:MAG TPA: hypothetical protein PK819_09015, partial [Thermomicrobiales bacterium]|nr:hypothetical protein [Thermomicrobiales bacterium]
YATGPTDSLHVAFSLNVATLPSTPLPLVTLADSEGGLVAGVYLMPDGSLVARWNGSDAASYLGVVAIGSWQQIEVGLDATAGTGELAVWVDGSSQVTISGPVVPIASILLGSWSADQTYALAIDSVSLASTCLGSCPAPVSAPTSEPVIVTEGTPVS